MTTEKEMVMSEQVECALSVDEASEAVLAVTFYLRDIQSRFSGDDMTESTREWAATKVKALEGAQTALIAGLVSRKAAELMAVDEVG